MRSLIRYRADLLARDPVLVSLVAASIVLLNLAFRSTGVLEASALTLSLAVKYRYFWSALLPVTDMIPPFVALYLGLKAVGPSLATGQYYVELAHAERKERVFDAHVAVIWVVAAIYLGLLFLNGLALHAISSLPIDRVDFIAWCVGETFRFGVYLTAGLLASVLAYGWSGLAACLAFFIACQVMQAGAIPFVDISLNLPRVVREVGLYLFPASSATISALRDDTFGEPFVAFIFRMGVPVQVYQALWIGGFTLLARGIAGRKDY